MSADLLTDDERVAMLQNYIAKGGDDLDMVTALVAKVIESGAWSSFTDQLGQPVEHQSFQSFVTTPRWRGLGTSKTALSAWVREQDAPTAEAVERAWRGEIPAARPVGRPTNNESATHITGQRDADSILARLKRDHPDLAESVVNGELSANAAAIRLGWRHPRIVATSPASVARKLREIWSDQQLEDLIQELEVNR